MDAAQLRAHVTSLELEVVVVVEGIDPLTSATVQARCAAGLARGVHLLRATAMPLLKRYMVPHVFVAPAHGPRHSYTAGELVLHHAFAPSVAQPDDPDRAACQLQVRPRPARAHSACAHNRAAHKAPRRRPGGPGRRRSSPGFTTWSQSAQARARGQRWWWPRSDAGRAAAVVSTACECAAISCGGIHVEKWAAPRFSVCLYFPTGYPYRAQALRQQHVPYLT